MDVYVIKTASGNLRPATQLDRDQLAKVEAGRIMRWSISLPRNPDFHNKFFALLRIGFRNQQRYERFEAFRYEVVVRCGFFETHVHTDGSVSFKPRSIAFHNMDQAEFEDLFSEAIDVLLREFVAGMSDTSLREAVAEEVVRFAA